MGTLTIRRLDETVKRKLRERAAGRGISMEQQSREIIASRHNKASKGDVNL